MCNIRYCISYSFMCCKTYKLSVYLTLFETCLATQIAVLATGKVSYSVNSKKYIYVVDLKSCEPFL